jgi:hypothetical protein
VHSQTFLQKLFAERGFMQGIPLKIKKRFPNESVYGIS